MFNFRIAICLVILVSGLSYFCGNLFYIESSFLKLCQLILVVNLGLQLAIRAINRFVFDDQATTTELQKKLEAFYERHEAQHAEILHERLDLMTKGMDLTVVIYFLCYHMPVFVCWLTFIFTGEHLTLFYAKIPLLSLETLHGYIVAMTFQTILASASWLGSFVLVYMFIMYGTQTISMVDVLTQILRDFGEDLNKKQSMGSKKLTESSEHELNHTQDPVMQSKHEKLIEIIKMFQEYDNYVSKITEMMAFPSFFAVTLNSISMGLGVLYVLTYSIPVGISILAIFFIEVSIPCVIGTIIDHQKNRLIDEVWSFPWYELSKTEMKIFLQFFHYCQKMNELEVPIAGNVDFELLVSIIYGTYTFFMFILNFVKI